jgi:hypothetical protein
MLGSLDEPLLEQAMQTVYQDSDFRIVSRTQVGDCTTVIPNWTIEQCRQGKWLHCAREFSKISAIQLMREIKQRLH